MFRFELMDEGGSIFATTTGEDVRAGLLSVYYALPVERRNRTATATVLQHRSRPEADSPLGLYRVAYAPHRRSNLPDGAIVDQWWVQVSDAATPTEKEFIASLGRRS